MKQTRRRLPPIADPVVWWIAVFILILISYVSDKLTRQEVKLKAIEKDAHEVRDSVHWLETTLKKGLGEE